MKKIVTHDSGFHADDVFAVATLLLKFGEAEVIRSRNQADIDSADFVVDVGMTYDPSKNRFDHHQAGGAGERSNGIPYASFGLVWKEFGVSLTGGEREANLIDTILAQSIDAHDNGVAVSKSFFEGVREYAIGDFFISYLNSSVQSSDDLYKVFMNLVNIAKDLLKREILRSKETIQGEDEVLKIYEESEDKRIIILPNGDLPWRIVLAKTPDAIYGVYPGLDTKWRVKTVPDISKPYGNERKRLPESWAGKTDEELQAITGVSDAVFAHRALFMAAAKSKEGAIKLANLALNA